MSAPRVHASLNALPEVLAQAGGRRVLVLSGPSQRYVETARALLAGYEIGVFAGARRHVPEDVVKEALRAFDALGASAIVAVGGGSAIGLGKALRLQRDAFFVAVPTTYAGSELTSLHGVTKDGSKVTGRDARVQPDAVIHEVELTLDMPKALTVTSLMNALAHCLAGLGPASDAALRERAQRAFESVYGALELLLDAPGSRKGRALALGGAALAGEVLEGATVGAHHRLAHRLGGRFDVDHGGLHSVLLPHSIARLRREAPDVVREIEERLAVPDLEGGLFDFLLRAETATSLKELGLDYAAFCRLVESEPELPGDLLRSAYHGRRPSRYTRLADFGLSEPVSLRGPELGRARRVIVAVHGRGGTADAVLRRAVELCGDDPEISVVAPQARDNAWYSGSYDRPRGELGSELESALRELETVLDRAVLECAPERVVLFGFSQGACLALELFRRKAPPLAALIALSGAGIGAPDESQKPERRPAGTVVLLGAGADDPWLAPHDLERTARALEAAGCDVRVEMTTGDARALHGRQRIAARELVRGLPRAPAHGGFGNFHESEDLPGALPRDRNSPRRPAYGLYAEQINGTGFVAPRHENLRSWCYRIRPSAQQGLLEPLAHPTFAADFSDQPPEPNLTGYAPLAPPEGPTDFVDGMATVGGAGSALSRRGFAVHVYAANRSMEDRCFYDADGDLLLLPELGALTLLTEFGVLDVAPGEIAIVPRGIRFSVLLRGEQARGYVGEVFGRHFELPERGPVGANGLAEARFFRAPSAWHEDRLAPGYCTTAKLGGVLYEAKQDYSPFDVVAWHGNYSPYVYDLSLFSPVGNTRIDHGDPSMYTVLTAPLDEQGSNALDLVVFPPRWDMTENTFRPPFFHRNATTEFNGIIREAAVAGSAFVPGAYFLTPSMAPHGVVAASAERALRGDDTPQRSSADSLWFQFETALPFSLSRWARAAPNRISDWRSIWGAYRAHFEV